MIPSDIYFQIFPTSPPDRLTTGSYYTTYYVQRRMKSYALLAALATVLLVAREASASGSLSGRTLIFAQETLSIGKDRNGRPDYCEITRQHTACNGDKVYGDIFLFNPESFSQVSLRASGFRSQLRQGAEQRPHPVRDRRDHVHPQLAEVAAGEREREEGKAGTAAGRRRHGANGEQLITYKASGSRSEKALVAEFGQYRILIGHAYSRNRKEGSRYLSCGYFPIRFQFPIVLCRQTTINRSFSQIEETAPIVRELWLSHFTPAAMT